MECPLLRLQTNVCHVCSIIVSVLLIMDLYHLLHPSQQRSQTQTGKFNTKLSRGSEEAEGGGSQNKNPHERNWADAVPTKTQNSGNAWRILRRAHTGALTKGKNKTQTEHRHAHNTCALTHTRTRLHRNISALFAKAETGSSSNISGTIWKPIVKKGMHSIDILLS